MMRTVDRSPNGRDSSATRAGANGYPNGPGNAALAKIVGKCQAVNKIKKSIRSISRFPNGTVLITGETGTGKELVADALHACSPRRQGPLVRVNCAAIPHNLFESQLFGHRKGAFSGALEHQKGLVEEAIGGVLFLDEISSLGVDLQTKLLRFLEDGTYLPLGESRERHSNAWVVAATNENLEAATANGSFRADLFHRLKSSEIRLPPLRERGEDALIVARHFLQRLAHESRGTPKQLSFEAQQMLARHYWPGNIRELLNVTRTLSTLSLGVVITRADVEYSGCIQFAVTDQERELIALDEVERRHILRVFNQNGRQIRKTARLLNIARNTLKRKLRAYGAMTTSKL